MCGYQIGSQILVPIHSDVFWGMGNFMGNFLELNFFGLLLLETYYNSKA